MEANKPEAKKLKPYSFDWWWEKGYQDCSNFLEPQHPKVKPYLEGYFCKEDQFRNMWGDVDFINE